MGSIGSSAFGYGSILPAPHSPHLSHEDLPRLPAAVSRFKNDSSTDNQTHRPVLQISFSLLPDSPEPSGILKLQCGETRSKTWSGKEKPQNWRRPVCEF